MARRKHQSAGVAKAFPEQASWLEKFAVAHSGDLQAHQEEYLLCLTFFAPKLTQTAKYAAKALLLHKISQALEEGDAGIFEALGKIIPLAKEQKPVSPIDSYLLIFESFHSGEISFNDERDEVLSMLFDEWPTTMADIHQVLQKLEIPCDPATVRDAVLRTGIRVIKGTPGRKKKN
jgi:hypothetical protein